MALKVADLFVKVDADTKSAETGMNRVSKGFLNMGSIVNTALGVFTGQMMRDALGSIVGLGKEALTAYADYETLGISLQSLAAKELKNASAVEVVTGSYQVVSQLTEEQTAKIAEYQAKLEDVNIALGLNERRHQELIDAGKGDELQTARLEETMRSRIAS
jgi:hypothetical protein